MKTSLALAVVLLPASLTIAACGSTEPDPFASHYALITIEGDPPPRLMGATEACDVFVDGGTLSFGQANSFDLAVDVRSDCSRAGGGEPTVVTYGYTGTVQLHDAGGVEFRSTDARGPISFTGTTDDSRDVTIELPAVAAFVSHVTARFEPR